MPEFVTDRDTGDESDTRWNGLSCGPWVSIPLEEAFGGRMPVAVAEESDVWVCVSVDDRTITYNLDAIGYAKPRRP